VLRQATVVLRAVRSAGLPVLLATLIVAVICIFGEPLYDSNDDPGIAMVGAGFGEAAHPDPHLVWCHYGYGLVLATLSKFVGPNAHGWVTIAAVWLSLALLIRALWRAQKTIVRFSLLLLSTGAIFSVALLSAEFTTTAGVLFGAAIASWLADETHDRKSLLAMAAIVLALILSYLIRPESYCLGLTIVMPALLFLCWRRRKLLSRYTVMGFCLAVIFALGFATDKLAYSTSADWRSVPEYNELRAQFNDYYRVPWRPQAPEYKTVGWTSNDYRMFFAWYSRDPIYSLENVSFLVQRLAVPRSTNAVAQIEEWFYYPFTDWPLLISLLGQIVILALLKRELQFVGFLYLAGEIVAIAFAAMIGKGASDYVWYAASATTLMCLSATLVLPRPKKASFLWSAGAVLPGLLGIVALVTVWYGHLKSTEEAAAYRKWINQNLGQLKGNVVVWSIGLRWECLITPTRIYAPFPELKVAAIDDLSAMPVETDMLKTLGIDDLAKRLCTDPQMTLICPKGLIPVLIQFGEEHYGITPAFTQIASYGDAGIYSLNGAQPQP